MKFYKMKYSKQFPKEMAQEIYKFSLHFRDNSKNSSLISIYTVFISTILDKTEYKFQTILNQSIIAYFASKSSFSFQKESIKILDKYNINMLAINL